MPNFLFNLWACNQWEPDVEQQNAVCTEDFGTSWDQSIWEAENDDYNSSPDQGSPYTAEEWYNELIKDWPAVTEPLINSANFIAASNVQAKAYWEANWRKKLPDGTPDPEDYKMQCFEYAAYQLLVAKNLDPPQGYRTTSAPNEKNKREDTYFQIFTLSEGINGNKTAEAIAYLKEAFNAKIPVMVGLHLSEYDRMSPDSKLGNYDKSTNHYVVLVTMNKDDAGKYYFGYYDYLSRYDPDNKLYLNTDLSVKDEWGFRQITHIRKSR